MKFAVFAKKKQTREGKSFTAYVGKLNKKDGTQLTCSVRFREECGSPKPENCPCLIEVEKAHANMVENTYTREDTGEDAVSYTLWVTNWKMSAEKYVDHSLDDFE